MRYTQALLMRYLTPKRGHGMHKRMRTWRIRPAATAWLAAGVVAAMPFFAMAEEDEEGGTEWDRVVHAEPVDGEDAGVAQADGGRDTQEAEATSSGEASGGSDEVWRLRAALSNVHMNAMIGFDERGVIRNIHQAAYISASIQQPEQSTVHQYRIRNFQDVFTSTGERLELSSRHHSEPQRWRDVPKHRHHSKQPLRIAVHFHPPRIPAQRIKRIAVDLELKVTTGRRMRIVLSPIGDYLNKNLRIANIADCRLRITRKGGNRLRVEYRGEGWKSLDEVRFEDGKGNELRSIGWRWAKEDWGYYREYRFEIPAEGKMVIRISEGLRTLPALFELEDVPFPGAIASTK